PDCMVIAEESTAWPMVSRPTYTGGVGFGLKKKKGWMHDTLEKILREPVHRSYPHNHPTFCAIVAFPRNLVFALPPPQAVHGKSSLLAKMPGDDWRRFANLRLLLAYQFAHPGKKLLFMGGDFGQWNEWNHESSLDWHLLQYPFHSGLRRWMRDLNTFYRGQPS